MTEERLIQIRARLREISGELEDLRKKRSEIWDAIGDLEKEANKLRAEWVDALEKAE